MDIAMDMGGELLELQWLQAEWTRLHQTMAQGLIDTCLAFLVGQRRAGLSDDHTSVAITKAKLRVYYALLQRDTTKCRSALDSLKALSHEQLDEAMEGGIEVHVWSSTPEGQPANYHGEKRHTDENARQLGKAVKNSIDLMERMYAEMEQLCM